MNDRWHAPIAPPDGSAMAAARARQGVLTKPPGSLGRLEELAIRLAGCQGREQPQLTQIQIAVFAADHGVVAEGISAYPKAVTAQMVQNFTAGGAAVAVLAREIGARLAIVDVGVDANLSGLGSVIHRKVAPGSANFLHGPAMSAEQLGGALAAGSEVAERAAAAGAELFIGGEMGIGNTTAATAIACALLGHAPHELAGPGTGLDSAGIRHKAEVIALALQRHPTAESMEVLRRLGGLEIAALVGSFIAAGHGRVPVLVDGFIATAAALVAVRLNPTLRPWLLFAHRSAEPGHAALLAALEADPLLDLGMRLGEGSGAAAAVPLLRLACRLHAGMATFAEAGVSDR